MADMMTDNPAPRTNHAATTFRGHMVIFGGNDARGVRLNDVRMLDMTTATWLPPQPPLGSSPTARALTSLTIASTNRLLLYGGLSEVDALNDLWQLSFPTCPYFSRLGVASERCLYQTTVCYITCAGGFAAPNGANPVVCGPDGQWSGYVPVCVPTLPGPPLNVIAGPTANNVTVSWSPPASTGYYGTITEYRVQTLPEDYMEQFTSVMGPSDFVTRWQWYDGSGGLSTYAWSGTAAVMDAAAGANCWMTSKACPMLIREWPATVSRTDFSIESHVILPIPTYIQASQMAGIMLYDPTGLSGAGYAPVYMGLRHDGSQYYVGSER